VSDELLTNLVAFELRREGRIDRVVGRGQTKALDGVRVAWLEVQQEHHAREGEVLRIYSEWELSTDDQRFVTAQFPDAELTYSFARPADDAWDAALEGARRSTEAAAAGQALDAAKTIGGRALLPVLRNADALSDVIAHSPLTPELGLFLAHVGTTAAGGRGIEYLTTVMVKEQKLKVKKLWEQAFTTLKHGLSIHAVEEDGRRCFVLEREGDFAAAAIGLPDFAEHAAGWAGERQLIVGLPNPDTLIVAAANSPMARRVEEIAFASDYQGAVNLTPCVLLVQGKKITLQAKQQ